MKSKRAQTATEYLIILAVVIIIALIVIGVLGRIPSLGGGASSNAASSYWTTSKIGIPSKAVTPDGNITVTLVNNMQGTIRIDTITFTDPNSETNTSSPARILAAGESSTFTVNNVSSANAGEKYSYDVSILYTDIETNTQYTFTGDGNRIEGSRTN